MSKCKLWIGIISLYLHGCTHSVSETTEAAALLIVAVPIGVVTSPIWVPMAIYDAKTAQIKRGATIEEVKSLLGEPVATYICENQFILLEYKLEAIKEGGHFLIFDRQEKFFNTTRNNTGCQPNTSL